MSVSLFDLMRRKMSNDNSKTTCNKCGKHFRTTQGLRGHEMFKCKARPPAPMTEEIPDTIPVSTRMRAYYEYLRRKGYENTIENFVDEILDMFFGIYAEQLSC